MIFHIFICKTSNNNIPALLQVLGILDLHSGRDKALEIFIRTIRQDLFFPSLKHVDILINMNKGSGTLVMAYSWFINKSMRQMNGT